MSLPFFDLSHACLFPFIPAPALQPDASLNVQLMQVQSSVSASTATNAAATATASASTSATVDAQAVAEAKRQAILTAAEAEFEKEMELIKKQAADLTYVRTGKMPRFAEAKQDTKDQLKVELRNGPELGPRTVLSETGEVANVHYGHGVFNRMRVNQAKQQVQHHENARGSGPTPMPAPTYAAPTPTAPQGAVRNFRFRSWTPPASSVRAPADLHGFHVSLIDASATVTASADEQARLEQELESLESTLLIEKSSSTSTTTESDAEHLDADASLDKESEESFFNVDNVPVPQAVKDAAHEADNAARALVETSSEVDAESEADLDVEADAEAETEAEEENHLNEFAAAESVKSHRPAISKSSSSPSPVNAIPSSTPAISTSASAAAPSALDPRAAPSFVEQSSTIKALGKAQGQARARFPAAPENPGWPFAEPEARETLYDAPNVEVMPGPNGYGNLNGYESHPHDSLLEDNPPMSDRLQLGLHEANPNRGIATGPNAHDVPVPYFPSQNPPPLAPSEKPAPATTLMVQGTVNQYMMPSMRPFSNQHEVLQKTRIPVSAQMAPPIGQGFGVSSSIHPRLHNNNNMLEMRFAESKGKAGLGVGVGAGAKVASGYVLPPVSQLNPNSPTPVHQTYIPAGMSQMPYPYQVNSGALPTSEFMRMPRQVPGFYGDSQLPHASWAQVGHVDPSLQQVQFMADTPYFPSQSVGPAFPPAAIAQPVNAAGGGGPRGYGGSMPFSPYLATGGADA